VHAQIRPPNPASAGLVGNPGRDPALSFKQVVAWNS